MKNKRKDYIKLNDAKKTKIKRIIERVVKKYDFVDSATLFGSFVNRKYFNDIDIALITKKKVGEDEILDMSLELEKKIGLEADIKIFDDLPLTFKFIVTKYGEPVFVRNKRKFLTDKLAVISEYLDFQPFKARNDARLLGWMK